MIHPKVTGATSGSVVGGALVLIVVYVLSLFNITVPQNVVDALTVIVGAALALIGGYVTPAPTTITPAAPPQSGT